MYSLFVGCDMSKAYFDASFREVIGKVSYLGRFDNTYSGFELFVKTLSKTSDVSKSEWLICFENTGVYSKSFLEWLVSRSITCKEESPLRIYKSSGIKRGKDDKIDSKDITKYVFEKRDSLRVSKMPKPMIVSLKQLLSRRDFLIRKKQSCEISIKEKRQLIDPHLLKILEDQNKELLELFHNQISKIEEKIIELIDEDMSIKTNYLLVQSIIGIGPIISAYLIAYTENFTLFNDSRKFASYSGVAPFPHRSGIKVGRTRVSHMANKKIKSLLSNGAISAIVFDNEIKVYYKRKLKEGKAKGTVLNAVKNKLIHRVFAVIKRQSPYVKIMNYA